MFEAANHFSAPLSGYYNYNLVALSYFLAVLASFVALEIAHSLRQPNVPFQHWKLWAGAFAMGSGIFTMHFIGMLAFKMPTPMNYDLYLTLASLLVAIIASAFAFYLIKDPNTQILSAKFIYGSIVLGIAIAAMHYTGMAALNGFKLVYIPKLFVLSILVSISASMLALWFMMMREQSSKWMQQTFNLFSALIMGIGICGMHYTAMAATEFYAEGPITPSTLIISSENLGMIVSFIASLIMIVTIIAIGHKYSVFTKLLLGFLSTNLLLIPVVIMLFENNRTVTDLVKKLKNNSARRIEALIEMKREAELIRALHARKTAQEVILSKTDVQKRFVDIEKWSEVYFLNLGENNFPAHDHSEFQKIKNKIIQYLFEMENLQLNNGSAEAIISKQKELRTAVKELIHYFKEEIIAEYKNLGDWLKVQTSTEQMRNLLFFFILFTLSMAIFTSILLTTQIAKPLNFLSKTAKKVREGSFKERISISSTDEIGELQHSFNEMVRSLETFNRRKDKIFAMTTHDLRNPLFVIMESAELLKEQLGKQISDHQKNLLSTIEASSLSMSSLLEELLALNLMQDETFHIVRQEVDILNFSHQLFEFNQLIARKKNINFELDLRLKSKTAYFDPAKITEVANNFLSNAFKFSPYESSVKLTIIENGKILRIEVEDEAGGIPVNEQKHVFTHFAKISVKPTGQESSHGLGLAISKDIITAHGGKIGFTSVYGKGSTFFLEINIEKPAQEDTKDEKKTEVIQKHKNSDVEELY